MKLTAIIMFLIPVVVARHNHRTLLETILKSNENLYFKVDDDVQNIMNNLFDSLNLAPDFPSKSRIKLLLTMHYDLKSIAAKNFEVHDKMLDAVEVSIDNNTTTGIALFNIIGDILDNKPYNLSSTLYGKYVPRKRTKHKKVSHVPRAVTTTTETILETTTTPQPVFSDSKEFMEFIQDFIKKIDQLSESDFSKPPPVAVPPEADDDDNLEYWEPPPVLELDFVNDTSRRIFKGKRSKIRSYPFMVSIHLMGTFACAGSILTKDLVISAASCLQLLHNNRFYRENPSSLSVRVGSDYFARGGEVIGIVETYFHPSYDPKTLANNLVLLRLYKHIKFLRREKKVKRIRFDRTPANLATNTEDIIVIGWGARKKSNVIDQFERMLVAKLDIYQKDVGGPGVVGGTLIGVISFGAPICGAVDSPTVFTKLGFYGKWIDSVIKTYGLVVGARTTGKPPTHQLFPYTSSTTVRINPFFSLHSTLGQVLPIARNGDANGLETAIETKRSGIKAIGARTTLRPLTRVTWPTFFITPDPKIIPITQTNAQEKNFKAKKVLKHGQHKPILTDIDSLPDVMYDDLPEEDVVDMFTTTTRLHPMQHPLVNKSFFPLPGLHIPKETSEYVTITLSSSNTLPPHLTEPQHEPTETVTERTASDTMGPFTDFFLNSYERTTEPSSYERRSSRKDRGPDSYLDNNLRDKHNSQSPRPHFRGEADYINDNYLVEPDLPKYA
ncbi:unnamed protein product [Spodoptera littoralis]|uniref:Peptidase S1 domain-containing protein n=1 Tax=Spodoptera littoralis TaxID=7109 RepID=A0A9P0I686_SPOLI|nr:unnamed protein product [Spodoptera littoralis]CAH1640523.1 unnamed protein product [Spodoptera littoralis]